MCDESVLKRAQESYHEVLDATKHQDDKIGRFLGAIAFVLAGALLFVEPTVLQARYVLGDARLALPVFALSMFLAHIVASALLYLLATSAPLALPRLPDAEPAHSHLFFRAIAGETGATWDQLWSDSTTLQDHLITEYIRETLNLAQRADNKAQRSQEASALFVLSLLSFFLP